MVTKRCEINGDGNHIETGRNVDTQKHVYIKYILQNLHTKLMYWPYFNSLKNRSILCSQATDKTHLGICLGFIAKDHSQT